MKTLVLFGAGASRAANAPLMDDFLDRADQFRRGGVDGGYQQDFQRVFDALSGLQPVYAKAFLDIDNIETFFGAVEMGQLLATFPGYKAEELHLLRTSLIRVIVKTLESSIKFETSADGIALPDPWARFGHSLQQLLDKNKLRVKDWTFLTFNYDILLDLTLDIFGIRYDYGLSGSLEETAIPVLKLHGSVNWAYCRKCDQIVPQSLTQWTGRIKPGAGAISLAIGSDIPRLSHAKCSFVFDEPPVLVPPTWDKGKHHAQLQPVWRLAARQLASAENLVIVGYSLPETDSFFRFLYALGTAGPTRLKNVTVIDPDERKDVRRRIESMTGRGIARRLNFMDGSAGKWETAVGTVLSLLAQ